MKKRCAQEALKYIKNGMVVGLGGGSTIGYLASYIEQEKLAIKIVTPSYQTASICREHHLSLIPTWSVDHVDIAFDGCDEVDLELNALKSGGAIHTKEKIIASMADEYVLLVDESKVFEKLPLLKKITLEVIPEAKSYVEKVIKQLGGIPSMRQSSAKDGYTISDHGNFIMEAKFKNDLDIKKLNDDLEQIVGIVATSLFVNKATMVISADVDTIRIIR